MGEAIVIFVVIWAWALLLLGFGAFIEWLGSMGTRRERDRPPLDEPSDAG